MLQAEACLTDSCNGFVGHMKHLLTALISLSYISVWVDSFLSVNIPRTANDGDVIVFLPKKQNTKE